VDIKNVLPKTESLIPNIAILYSIHWRHKKYTPKIHVKAKEIIPFILSSPKIAWWAQVTLTPEDNKITVFNSGTWKAFKGSTPQGGHILPNSTTGLNLEWKNAQKKDMKKKTSLTINKIIPNIKPLTTTPECPPWNVLSRMTSRHQAKTTNNIIIKEKNIKLESA